MVSINNLENRSNIVLTFLGFIWLKMLTYGKHKQFLLNLKFNVSFAQLVGYFPCLQKMGSFGP